MRIMLIVLIAYVITGAHYVWRDLREPLWNQPAYVSNGISARLFMVLYWLPGTIFSTYLRGPIKRHIASWLLFVALIAIGFATNR
ncbi:hypothetical protein [Bradyrhizobium lablabi]|nr:hypothetical protein [Bradyrhizobium lablabi]